jgi:hypothetical protein
MDRSCSRFGGRYAFKILGVKTTGNRSLGRPWRRYEHNIRIYLKEIGIDTMNWIDY